MGRKQPNLELCPAGQGPPWSPGGGREKGAGLTVPAQLSAEPLVADGRDPEPQGHSAQEGEASGCPAQQSRRAGRGLPCGPRSPAPSLPRPSLAWLHPQQLSSEGRQSKETQAWIPGTGR